MEELINELKERIIEALNLSDLSQDDFDCDAPLFGDDGIGLDSIDALEIIRLANAAEGKDIFKSVRTIAEYVAKNRKK